MGNSRSKALSYDCGAKLDSPIKKGRTLKMNSITTRKPRVRRFIGAKKLTARPPEGMDRALQLKGKLLLFFRKLFLDLLIAERPNQFNSELGSEELTACDNNQTHESSSGMCTILLCL
jgi:hypothetical protein